MTEYSVHDSPYKGLVPYAEEDAPLFFGRQAELEIIAANMIASRLTLLYGPSGVGKSSVLRAGVAHHLREVARENLVEFGTLELAVVVFSSWRDDPLVGLLAAARTAVAQALQIPSLEPAPSARPVVDQLQDLAERVSGRLLVILDQFEEYFLYHPTEDGDGTFAVEFPRAVNRADLRVNFLISMREDAVAKLDRFKGRIAGLFEHYLRIDHLDREAARAAIVSPIEAFNRMNPGDPPVVIESALIDAVLDEVRTGQVVIGEAGRGSISGPVADAARDRRIETPFLQLVMTRLWNEETQSGSRCLRRETLDRLGGAENIVRTHLNTMMDDLPAADQAMASSVFHYLITPSGAKIAHTARDLAEYTEIPEAELTPVLERLSGARRILRAVQPPPGEVPVPRYEIFHDVLGAAILDWRARYVQALDRDTAERKAAEERRRAEELQRRADEQARVARQFRRLSAALGLVILMAMVAAGYAWNQRRLATAQAEQAVAARQAAEASKGLAEVERRRAQDHAQLAEQAKGEAVVARRVAEEEGNRATQQAQKADQRAAEAQRANAASFARELAAAAVSNLEKDPELSVLLALHAADLTLSADGSMLRETEDALRQAVQASRVRLTVRLYSGAAGREGGTYVAFSPDGSHLATASRGDGSATVWDATNGRRIRVLYGQAGGATAVSYSPDGKRLATAGREGAAIVWDVGSGRKLHILSGHMDEINAVAFSPDGKRLATGSSDGLTKLWEVGSGRLVRTLSGHTNQVKSIAFTPDGQRLVTAGADRTVRVWDVDSGGEVFRLDTGAGSPSSVSVSPDGRLIALGGLAGEAQLWDAVSGRSVGTLSGHSNAVFDLAFSPDARRLATAGFEGTVKVWDVESRRELFALAGHARWTWGVVFSPDGKRLATVSGDGTARVWKGTATSGEEVLSLAGDASAVGFSPDGTRLAAAGLDGATRVWDIASGKELLAIGGQPGGVAAVAFGPDGRRIVTAGRDHAARVWDAVSGEQLLTIAGHAGRVASVAFSPDGTRLATASHDNAVRLWSASSGKQQLTLSGHQDSVTAVAFSFDGKRVVTASDDSTARVWDASSGQELRRLSGHLFGLTAVAFSPDGQRIATGGLDRTARLWDATSGKELHKLEGHSDVVIGVAFTPDGKQLATAASDRVILWDAVAGQERRTLSSQARGFRDFALSRDGKHLAAAAQGTVHVYALRPEDLVRLGRTRAMRDLTHGECRRFLRLKECPATPLGLVEDGRTFASFAGGAKKPEALARFRRAIAMDPALDLQPESEANRFLAAGLLRVAAGLFRVGTGVNLEDPSETSKAVNNLLDFLTTAKQLDPDVDLDPGQEARRLIAAEFVHRGRRFARAGDVEGAMTYFQRAVRVDAALRIDPSVESRWLAAQALVERAQKHLESDQPRDAIGLLEKAISLSPAHGPAHRLLGVTYRDQGEFDRAITRLHTVVELDPSPASYADLADSFRLKEDYDQAFFFAGKALAANPRYGYGLLVLGLIRRDSGKPEEAVDAFGKVTRTDPSFKIALQSSGGVYFDKLFDYQAAYEKFSELSASYPEDKDITADLAEAALATERLKEAHALAGRTLGTAARPPSVQLAMKFVMIASLVLRGERAAAHKVLGDFVKSYESVVGTYKPGWSFTGTKRFIAQRPMDEGNRRVLLRLIAILETPTPGVRIEQFEGALR